MTQSSNFIKKTLFQEVSKIVAVQCQNENMPWEQSWWLKDILKSIPIDVAIILYFRNLNIFLFLFFSILLLN